jgi:hypothetical protein
MPVIETIEIPERASTVYEKFARIPYSTTLSILSIDSVLRWIGARHRGASGVAAVEGERGARCTTKRWVERKVSWAT